MAPAAILCVIKLPGITSAAEVVTIPVLVLVLVLVLMLVLVLVLVLGTIPVLVLVPVLVLMLVLVSLHHLPSRIAHLHHAPIAGLKEQQEQREQQDL
jgi:hypothetical protein